MRGRSAEQVAAYEARLADVVDLLAAGPMTVREIREALALPVNGTAGLPAAATVYARIRAVEARGIFVKRRKRREKVPGKPGQHEVVFSIEEPVRPELLRYLLMGGLGT